MIVFVHIPKTAGTTFRFILENNFVLSHCQTNHSSFHDHSSYAGRRPFTADDLRFAEKVFPRLKSIAGHNLVSVLDLPVQNPFHVTFLRDPVARVLSQYQETVIRYRNQGRPLPDFEQALRTNQELENLQVKMLAGGRDLDKARRFLENCSFVGLTEKFDVSLHALSRVYPGRLNLKYQKRRVARDNSVKKAIEADPRLMEMAREVNHLDLKLYSFAAAEIFPGLCRKAGIEPDARVATYGCYSSEKTARRIVNGFYNRCVYRQLCKLRQRSRER